MSQTALQDFAKIAQQLAEALDRHKPTQGNQTLLVLADLAKELPDNNPLRQSIEQQMAKIAATDFALDNQDLNKTLIVLGSLKGRLAANDASQDKIDLLMAKVLSSKFDIVNGQVAPEPPAPVSQPEPVEEAKVEEAKVEEQPAQTQEAPMPESPAEPANLDGYSISIPEPSTEEPAEPASAEETNADNQSQAQSEDEPQEQPAEPETAPAAEEAPVEAAPVEQPAVEAQPEAQPASDDSAFDEVHTVQIALDQLPLATRQAFEEFKPIEEAGSVQAYVDGLKQAVSDPDQANDKVKSELDRLKVLLAKIEDAPAEADQFQVLYDQVDPKHKDEKTGVFSIFQREYGGNARRFVVQRTAQYAKYVDAEESRQRMIEDLHKLADQAQKCLDKDGQSTNSSPAPASNPNNRAFFHG